MKSTIVISHNFESNDDRNLKFSPTIKINYVQT